MPGSELITLTVKGVAVGSHQDLYSGGVGYITFVRGSGKNDKNNTNEMLVSGDVEEDVIQHNNEELTKVVAKESQIANIYRRSVFWPLIQNIREKCYD